MRRPVHRTDTEPGPDHWTTRSTLRTMVLKKDHGPSPSRRSVDDRGHFSPTPQIPDIHELVSSHTLPIADCVDSALQIQRRERRGFGQRRTNERLPSPSVYAEARSRQLPPVQVSETELTALREFAKAHGLSLADLMRSALAQHRAPTVVRGRIGRGHGRGVRARRLAAGSGRARPGFKRHGWPGRSVRARPAG